MGGDAGRAQLAWNRCLKDYNVRRTQSHNVLVRSPATPLRYRRSDPITELRPQAAARSIAACSTVMGMPMGSVANYWVCRPLDRDRRVTAARSRNVAVTGATCKSPRCADAAAADGQKPGIVRVLRTSLTSASRFATPVSVRVSDRLDRSLILTEPPCRERSRCLAVPRAYQRRLTRPPHQS